MQALQYERSLNLGGKKIGRKKKAILRCSHLDLGATDAWYKRARKQPLAPAAGPTGHILEEGQRAHDAHRRRLLPPPVGSEFDDDGVFNELSVFSVLVDVEARGLHLAHACVLPLHPAIAKGQLYVVEICLPPKPSLDASGFLSLMVFILDFALARKRGGACTWTWGPPMHGTNAHGSSRSRRLRGLLEEGQRAHDAHRRRLLPLPTPCPSGVSLTTTVYSMNSRCSVSWWVSKPVKLIVSVPWCKPCASQSMKPIWKRCCSHSTSCFSKKSGKSRRAYGSIPGGITSVCIFCCRPFNLCNVLPCKPTPVQVPFRALDPSPSTRRPSCQRSFKASAHSCAAPTSTAKEITPLASRGRHSTPTFLRSSALNVALSNSRTVASSAAVASADGVIAVAASMGVMTSVVATATMVGATDAVGAVAAVDHVAALAMPMIALECGEIEEVPHRRTPTRLLAPRVLVD